MHTHTSQPGALGPPRSHAHAHAHAHTSCQHPRRRQAPLKALLSRNKLKPSDVDAVELLGGGSRVPKLQTVLSEALGGR
jgi:hypothetical protein